MDSAQLNHRMRAGLFNLLVQIAHNRLDIAGILFVNALDLMQYFYFLIR